MKAALAVSIVLLFCFSVAFSQARPLDRTADARRLLAETPHRVTMTVEMRETADSPWEPYSSQTKEVSGDRWHLVQETGLKLELIGIGDLTYQKMPNGSWQVRAKENGYTGPTVTQVSGTGFGSTYEKKEGTKTVVVSREYSKIQLPSDGSVVEMDRKTREWFDDSGRLTRAETEHFNFERKRFQRVTEVYEYDPAIKIEAPTN